ncbi:MAG: polyprenol monophosphomannose synthase [Planctomycetes bacterium]|nr:polyprenol monophosphomannose synthase [Planctomycetota bacterium]
MPGGERKIRRVIITVPTWNESLNIQLLTDALLALNGKDIVYEVLVADDHSPDGTWKLVEDRAKTDRRVHLLHRTEDRGRGRAGRDAFVKALAMGADAAVEMDADFSHPPRYIPIMIQKLEDGADLVLGSRGVEGGRDLGRPFLRRMITKLANLYIRVMLGLNVRDCNSGFRAWRASALRAVSVENTFSQGPAIVQELLFKARRRKLNITEIPIEFVERERGESSLTFGKLMQGYVMVLRLRWRSLAGTLWTRQ